MNKERRKELINAYKRTFRPPGVIAIRNLVNGKIFIGASLDVNKLANRYKAELASGGHVNKALQADWNEYGADKFSFEVLEEIKESDSLSFDYDYALKTLINSWIQKLNPFGEKGYHDK